MNDASGPVVGFIGLGIMGGAMVANLQKGVSRGRDRRTQGGGRLAPGRRSHLGGHAPRADRAMEHGLFLLPGLPRSRPSRSVPRASSRASSADRLTSRCRPTRRNSSSACTQPLPSAVRTCSTPRSRRRTGRPAGTARHLGRRRQACLRPLRARAPGDGRSPGPRRRDRIRDS